MDTIRGFFGGRAKRSDAPANVGVNTPYVNFMLGADGNARVTSNNALAVDAVFACVDLISRSLAMMPIQLLKTEANGDRTPQTNNAVFLIAKRPNRNTTSFNFRRALIAQAVLFGNGYAYIVRAGDGSIVEILNVPTSRVQLVDTPGGLRYHMSLLSESGHGSGPTVVAHPDDVIHLRGLSLNGVTGIDIIKAHGMTMAMALNITKYGSSYFGNHAQVAGVVESPHDLGAAGMKKLRDQLIEHRAGGSRAGDVLVLDEGMKFNPVGTKMGETSAIEAGNSTMRSIARIFGVPSYMIGDMERATFDNVEHLSQQFINQTLMPWAQQFEEELARTMLTERQYQSMRYNWQHDFESYLRADTLALAKKAETLLKWGVVMRNEARRMVGLNSGGPELDTYLVPLNMVNDNSDPTADGAPTTDNITTNEQSSSSSAA